MGTLTLARRPVGRTTDVGLQPPRPEDLDEPRGAADDLWLLTRLRVGATDVDGGCDVDELGLDPGDLQLLAHLRTAEDAEAPLG
jgi:hypothetical protein